MNLHIKLLTAFAMLFCGTLAHADTGSTSSYKDEQKYTNGFLAGLNTSGNLALAYRLGNNNNWGLTFRVSPYQSIRNLDAIAGDDSWLTKIGAEATNYLPLARKPLNNKLFFLHGPKWTQHFGTAERNNAKIKYSFRLAWLAGLEYRFKSRVYLGVASSLVGYQQSHYKTGGVLQSLTVPIDRKERSWNILSYASVYLMFQL